MPPRKRDEDKVKVEPASAAQPRARATGPTKRQVNEAVERSAEYLEQQAQEPEDVHPRATMPKKAEVEAAVERSGDFLEETGQTTGDQTGSASPVTRDRSQDAAPVPAGGTNTSLAASPVYSGRDKTQDASPTFSAPLSDRPSET